MRHKDPTMHRVLLLLLSGLLLGLGACKKEERILPKTGERLEARGDLKIAASEAIYRTE